MSKQPMVYLRHILDECQFILTATSGNTIAVRQVTDLVG